MIPIPLMFRFPLLPRSSLFFMLPARSKILREYERVVIVRLARLLSNIKGQGIIPVFCPVDHMIRISCARRRSK